MDGHDQDRLVIGLSADQEDLEGEKKANVPTYALVRVNSKNLNSFRIHAIKILLSRWF